MERYFSDKSEELKKELDSWLSTPYRHFSGVKNKGADCIHFVVAVLNELGANQGRNLIIRNYNKDWHLHRGEELLVNDIEKQIYVKKIAERINGILIFSENIGNGDLILFKYGRLSSHCGIYCQKQVYQSLNPSGVEKISFNNASFLKRVMHIYKIYKA